MNARAVALEHRFEIPAISAAVLTLPFLLLEDGIRHGPWHTVGSIGSLVVWIVFLAEAVAMLAVVDSRRRWLLEHPLDVAIVVLTPPFLFTAIQGLRVLRVLRLLRMFRLAPFIRRFLTPDGLRYAAFLALLVLLISAEAFASVEKISYGNGIYWAITTMTTVGYGDTTPHTTVGKIVASIVMLVGIGFFAVLTGAVAQQFLASEIVTLEEEERDLVSQIRDIGEQLHALEQQALLQAKRRGS
jgi:voltage-gated potassium channel